MKLKLSPFRRFSAAVVMAMGLVFATPAVQANEGLPPSPRFENLLRAIDVVPPDAAALLTAFPDAQARLIAAAGNAERDTWTRIRAISFLSFLPDDTTRTALIDLASDADATIRSHSVYTLARGFGPVRPDIHDGILKTLEASLTDPAAEVREKAVRGLRWVRDGRAVGLLDRAAVRPDLKGLADATRHKRQLRLKALGHSR